MQYQRLPLNAAGRGLPLAIVLLALGCNSSPSSNTGGEGSAGAGGNDVSTDQGGSGGGARGGSGGTSAGGTGGIQGGKAGGEGGQLAGGAAGSNPGTGGKPTVANTATCIPPKLKLTRLVPQGTFIETDVLTQPPNDPRIYVVQRTGLIRVLKGTAVSKNPFLDLRRSVPDLSGADGKRNERGLLGFAFHPKDANRFFVMYARDGSDPQFPGMTGDIIVAQGKRSAQDPEVAEPKLTLLFMVPHSLHRYHNGGLFAFGADGLLYIGLGEAGLDGHAAFDGATLSQKAGPAQDPKQKIAKIIRLDVDNPTAKPAGNWSSAGADPLVWAVGLRNPWRGSFDRATGDLYFGDVGEGSWEEINFVREAHKQMGLNFGWGFLEANHCFPWFFPLDCTVQPGPRDGVAKPPMCDLPNLTKGMTLPVLEYAHPGTETDPKSAAADCKGNGKFCGGASESCSRAVVGGYVYRGKKIKDLYGRYIYGDHAQDTLASFIVDDAGKATCQASLTDLAPGKGIAGLTSFGEDADGELYTLDLNGNVFRIDPAP